MDPLKRALLGIFQKTIPQIAYGTVKAIQDNKYSCIVVVDGIEIPDVRLKASIGKSDEEYFIVTPRIGSNVLIGLVGDDENAAEFTVLKCDEVDGFYYKNKVFEMEQKLKTLTIKNEKNFINILDDTINIDAGGEGKSHVSLQDDKIVIMSGGGRVYMNSDQTSLGAVFGKIADVLESLSSATCPPNAPLNVAAIATKIAAVRSEASKLTPV